MTELTKAFCNQCGRDTNHEVLYPHRHKYRDEELEKLLREDVPGAEAWYTVLTEMLTCRGCDGVSVRQRTWMGEEERTEEDLRQEFGDDDLKDYLTTSYYPPISARRKPAWMSPNSGQAYAIPDEIKELMEELYVALQNGCHRLAVMGARTVLESIMKSIVGAKNSFNEYLNEFQKAYYISLHQREILHTVLDAGNAAAHRAWKANDRRLSTIIEITERWVEMVFLHQPLAEELESGVPRRPPRPEAEVSRRRKRPPS